jgi:Holliday junction resolvase RusA-like endonuclease
MASHVERDAMTPIEFIVPGPPQGKGRARVGKVGGHVRMFTPKKTVSYESLIAYAAKIAMRGMPPADCPFHVELLAVHAVPASWSRVKQNRALLGLICCTTKPDLDNVLKSVGDACNEVVWRDDRQIVSTHMSRAYGTHPGLLVRVRMAGGTAVDQQAQMAIQFAD